MRQIPEFQSNFENISATVARQSRDIRESVSRLSRKCIIFILIRTTIARHSCECRTTFLRMSLSFIFSPDSREFFACCLKTIAGPLCDTRTTFVRVSRKFCIVNSPKFHGDRFATFARTSHDSLAKYFGEKICFQFLNMFKTFATSSRLVRDT